MNDEIEQLVQERENRIEQAIKKQRINNVIFLITQYLIAVILTIALYYYFDESAQIFVREFLNKYLKQ